MSGGARLAVRRLLLLTRGLVDALMQPRRQSSAALCVQAPLHVLHGRSPRHANAASTNGSRSRPRRWRLPEKPSWASSTHHANSSSSAVSPKVLARFKPNSPWAWVGYLPAAEDLRPTPAQMNSLQAAHHGAMAMDRASAWLSAAIPGPCDLAPTDNGRKCNTDNKGSFGLSDEEASSWLVAAATCLRHCESCARCRYVSVSRDFRDCSWYHTHTCERAEELQWPGFLSGPAAKLVARGRHAGAGRQNLTVEV